MTKRSAFVAILNNTGVPMVGVSLLHKYSNEYKHQRQWGIIGDCQTTSETLKVEYNQGAFTTGRDWWLITWYSPDMKTLYYSNPDNFRDIVDKLESIAPTVIAAAAGGVAGLTSSWSGPGSVLAASLAAVAALETTKVLFNSEGTVGFKQHILREEDENAVTLIVVQQDGTIEFQSNSGTSETVFASTEAPSKKT